VNADRLRRVLTKLDALANDPAALPGEAAAARGRAKALRAAHRESTPLARETPHSFGGRRTVTFDAVFDMTYEQMAQLASMFGDLASMAERASAEIDRQQAARKAAAESPNQSSGGTGRPPGWQGQRTYHD